MIKTITVTGADDSVKDLNELVRMSEKFPKIEWGILLSKNNVGSPRFPSSEWIFDLAYFYHNNPWLLSQLPLIRKVCGPNKIWIDAETHLRSDNDRVFDLDKVNNFLKEVYLWCA